MIINLTPHPVRLMDAQGQVIREWPAAKEYVRLDVQRVEKGEIEEVPVGTTHFGEPYLAEGKGEATRRVADFPAPQDGVYYIVPGLVMTALRRPDLLAPTQEPKLVLRDEAGRVLGVQAFDVAST